MYITCMTLSGSIRRGCWIPETVAIDCYEPHEVGMGTRLLCSANAAGAVNSLANAPEPDI